MDAGQPYKREIREETHTQRESEREDKLEIDRNATTGDECEYLENIWGKLGHCRRHSPANGHFPALGGAKPVLHVSTWQTYIGVAKCKIAEGGERVSE